MRVPDHPTLIRRMLGSRLRQLGLRAPVLAASLNVYRHRCGQPTCRCHHGGPWHTGQHVTCKLPGNRTRSVYVPKDLVMEVQAWIAGHKRLKQLLKEIQQLSLALIRTHVRDRRRKAGRC